MKTTLLFLSVFLTTSLFGQGWIKSYYSVAENQSRRFIRSSDGGYLLCGYTEDLDGQLIKTDEFGKPFILAVAPVKKILPPFFLSILFAAC